MKNKVFILHGWSYSTEKWNPFTDLLKQKGIKPNLLNIPGLTENNDKVWNLDEYVEWLRQKINNQKVILIGHSNGGRIVLNFAAKYPNLLSNLVLIASAGIYHDDLAIRVKRLVFKAIASIGRQVESGKWKMENLSKILKDILYKLAGETDYKNADPKMRQTMINLINSDKLLDYNKIITPTLIIWGRNDKTTPFSDGKLMHKLIKNSKLYVVDDAKHSPQFTNTQEVVDLIYEYF